MSIETIKTHAAEMLGLEFPLLMGGGTGVVVASDETGLSLLLRGVKARFSWPRVRSAWERLEENHALSADEIGGGADGIGLVSLLAFVLPQEVGVPESSDGLITYSGAKGVPVHQYADMSKPTTWAPWRQVLVER